MEVTGLGWLGVRTERFEETVRFFRDVMGLGGRSGSSGCKPKLQHTIRQ
jgi:hypothetical protein